MIKVENLKLSFGKNEVLKGINFKIEKGQVISIIGPSGSGKSTFLRSLNFLETASSGTITFGNETFDLSKINKKDINRLRKNTTMVFQNYNLFKNKTALENVIEGLLIVKKMNRNEATEIGLKMLEKVGLKDKAEFYPNQLSGGQQQRVGIARALVIDPEIIFADEPTGNLDSHTTEEVLTLMRKIVEEQKKTLIMVTHDPHIASWSDRQLRIVDGRIVETVLREGSKIEEEILEKNGERPFTVVHPLNTEKKSEEENDEKHSQ